MGNEEDTVSEPTIITKQVIEQVFDDSAISYDRVGPSIFTQFGNRLVERMPLFPGARVLDVATGKGAVLLPVARRVGPQGHVIGIDLSRTILKEAECAVRAGGITNVELHKMDAEHLELPDQTFDFVSCAFALFLFPNMNAALGEMYRVCKPGGYVSLSVFGKPPPMFSPGMQILIQQFMAYGIEARMPQPLAYTPQEINALLSQSGFHSVETNIETNDIVYANLEDVWGFLLTLPIRAPIMDLSEETRARFKAEYLAKLTPALRPDGLHMALGIVYALAKR
jgi:O-methyltransferase/aklanonic acid methyltransferase